MRWEYLLVQDEGDERFYINRIRYDRPTPFADYLNGLGSEGWEMVNCCSYMTDDRWAFQYVFKRVVSA